MTYKQYQVSTNKPPINLNETQLITLVHLWEKNVQMSFFSFFLAVQVLITH